MTFWPKLVALDVDGTLVDGHNAISPATADAVRAIVDAGMHVVVSTGRAAPGALEVSDRLDLPDGLAVCSNGAVVIGYRPVEVIHAVTFDASDAVRRVLNEIPDALVAVEEVGVGYRVNRPFPRGEISGRITVDVDDVEALVAEPVTRVIIRADGYDPGEFHALVRGLGLTDTNYYIGYTAWLDIAPLGVSKASGLALVCERLGVEPSDVLAVGDGHNDVEMLEWAGRGVAMGHGPDALRNAADHVTGTIHEDGLAQELARYF